MTEFLPPAVDTVGSNDKSQNLISYPVERILAACGGDEKGGCLQNHIPGLLRAIYGMAFVKGQLGHIRAIGRCNYPHFEKG